MYRVPGKLKLASTARENFTNSRLLLFWCNYCGNYRVPVSNNQYFEGGKKYIGVYF